MTVNLSALAGAGQQFLDANGNPLTGGKLYSYEAGTTTPQITYTTVAGDVPHSNPIILDSAGRVPGGQIWLTAGQNYKFVLTSSTDVSLGTWDNITGIAADASGLTYTPAVTSLLNGVVTNTATALDEITNEETGSSVVGFIQSGVNAVAKTVQAKLRETVSVKDFGAVGDGVADDTAAIQAAVNAINTAGGGAVYFPTGEYKVTSEITIFSNTKYYGDGKASLLKWGDTTAGDIFSRNSSTIDNVTITGLGFDGSINYPPLSNVGINSFSEYNKAIDFAGTTVTNLIIQNCFFNQLSDSSIDINGLSSSKIVIDSNIFDKGAYRFKVISVRTPTNPATRNQFPNSIVVTNNVLNENGPQIDFNPDPSINWNGSADAIQLDLCRDSLVVGNVVKRSSGIGIRIEQCENVTVCGNTTFDTGAEGISVYNESNNCSVVGNVVENFGKIPPANSIRNYTGTYYVARETVSPAFGVSPPADPSTSPFFDVWPYSLDNVNIANIQAYSVSETTLIPFRGYAGISATARSKSNTITGNVVTRNMSVDGSGRYLYANDFGFTVVHQANNPSTNVANNVITGNRLTGQLHDIYHPQYTDPINTNGTLTNATYGVNDTLNNNFIYINALTFSDLDVRSLAGTGTETLLRLLNQTNSPGTGLGVKIQFQAILSTDIGSISAAMVTDSFAAGSSLSLKTRAGDQSHISLVANAAERLRIKPNGQTRFLPLASAPSGAEEGDVYFNTTTKKLQCYDGTVWQNLF